MNTRNVTILAIAVFLALAVAAVGSSPVTAQYAPCPWSGYGGYGGSCYGNGYGGNGYGYPYSPYNNCGTGYNYPGYSCYYRSYGYPYYPYNGYPYSQYNNCYSIYYGGSCYYGYRTRR